ncbi:hypothetical protein BCR34DRAFT_606895 [Clohesyomyces aquaticus]|uniref:Uncharacterized protein n=1 Tax=Clohesyomyces aquaticus TaxID=1231657 RepID=A0A1Y1YKK8_9PLEO|nr:hypothetical protein BCR34DRAFT_606895 [Clohesyomyces aquaticus]
MSYRADSISASSNRFNNSAISVFRKLKARKLDEPFLEPVHLEISKKISFDQRSERTRSSSSNMTISSGRLSKISPPISDKRSDSVSSKDWKSSEYDTSWLREADLKKCKKKGINPALYAEMKAARKGKWMSPIVGNIIL